METSSVYTLKRIPENLIWSEGWSVWVPIDHQFQIYQKIFISKKRALTVGRSLQKHVYHRKLKEDLLYKPESYEELTNKNFQIVMCEHKLLLSFEEIVK